MSRDVVNIDVSSVFIKTVESRSLYERLYAAYSWLVDADLPMRREHAPILLEAAEEVKRLREDLESLAHHYEPHEDCSDSNLVCDYRVKGKGSECPCQITARVVAEQKVEPE